MGASPEYVTLDGLGLTSHEARHDWAMRRSRKIQAARAAMAAGEHPVERASIGEAVQRYLEHAENSLAPKTVVAYRKAITRFETWVADEGLRRADQLSGPALARLREWLIAIPMSRARSGKEKGARRSPVSVNVDVRALKTMLGYWRRWGLVPLIDRDALADTLAPLKMARSRPVPLKPKQITKLLEAALEHDDARFKLTRSEKAGREDAGLTRCHDPIAPFVLFTLLSGCRVGEVLSLDWQAVDLDAHEGTGEVIITAVAAKTRAERAIRLDVSPSLRGLLAALHLRFGGRGPVFRRSGRAPTRDWIESTRRRLIKTFGCPEFTWQQLRQTCGSYLSNAPGIYRGASAFMSAKRLGHSVVVAETRYVGIVTVKADAESLEQAMGIVRLADRAVASCSGSSARPSAGDASVSGAA